MIELDGFELRGIAAGAGDPVELGGDRSPDWIPAQVPGGVHESLIAAGRLSDPRRGGHERDADDIERLDWWFRSRFAAPVRREGDRVRLTFDGLDTIVDIWLDGTLLGHHENQFRPAEFDVTEQLGDSGAEHVLVLRFTPPLPAEPAEGEEPEGVGPRGAMLRVRRLRKAAFSWGWDFGPRLPAVGIGRPVRLEIVTGPRITGHQVAVLALAPDRSEATVRLRAEVESVTAEDVEVAFTLTSPDGRRYEAAAAVHAGVAQVDLAVPDPALWWTHDLGDPALHDLRIQLGDGAGAVSVEDRVGLRTIELDRSAEPTEGGRLFRFVLNGLPLFARGANWVPPSPFVGTPEPALVRDRVLRAREGNLTMLRVWGGGVYEHDAFYRACDELGVLVWQDFMFACIDYPGDDDAFRAEVEGEARAQVARLRNHACLALWCGNNEVEIIHLLVNGGLEGGDWGRRIFHELLPAIVDEVDGFALYWPGSPWGEGGPTGINGVVDGDRHDWEVWHGLVVPGFTLGADAYPTPGDARHYRRYADDTGRFVSEFGILAAPDRGTLDRWMPGIALHDAVFDRHLSDHPADKGDELFAVTTGVPEDLDEYVALSQAVQAEAMLFAMEHFRRRQPRTSGALVWQFDDTWPAMTWSLVDADGVPKAAYYSVARASAPLAVSWLATPDDGLELWLINNTVAPVEVEAEIELGSFDGADRTSAHASGRADAGVSMPIWSGSIRQDAAHYAWASSADARFPAARKHFAELGELELGAGRVETSVVDGGLELVSRGYCYGVRIAHPVPVMRLSDNCFDLRDGERRVIRVEGADPASLTATPTIPRARRGMERPA